MNAVLAGLDLPSVPDLSVVNTDFLTPLTGVVTDVNSRITALTASLGTLDCLAGNYGSIQQPVRMLLKCDAALPCPQQMQSMNSISLL